MIYTYSSRSALLQTELEGLRNVTKRSISCVPIAVRPPAPRRDSRASELDYLMEQIGGDIYGFLIMRANARIDAANEADQLSTDIPHVGMKQFMGWVGSEYAYSNSKEDSYSKLRRAPGQQMRSQGITLWQSFLPLS